ncbi:MAG TPA: hypothetical protein VFR41_12030 [Acidimicrobiia bacterium]|nr:hypothetical protein [Acidimicrobiia bacterium]
MGIVHLAVALHRCTFEIWDGDVDEAEVTAHLLRLAEDADWPPGRLNLVDLTTVGRITVPDPELVALLREGTILEHELKTALVVPAEFLDGNAPEYDESARATGVTTFADIRSASEHLGISVQAALTVMEQLRNSL